MSDTDNCPLCHKYIDTTFAIDECPKCHGSLVETDLFANELESASDVFEIQSHIFLSIISLFFFLPFGIVALIFAIKTNNAKNRLDYKRAVLNSKKSQTFAFASIIIGGVLIGLSRLGSR
ncbi:MAG: CD225/dispanin family protein [Pyrinomonadaceae bacterium]